MTFDTIIKGGTIVTAADAFMADIGIRNGRIAAIGEALEGAGTVIDATGRLVMPGGIDSHVHIAQPGAPEVVMAEDFTSGTIAAAFGGNTTVMPFCLQQRGQSLREALKAYHAEAEGRCHVDVSFHLILTDPTPGVLGQELPALVEEGYTSLKVFMTYDDMVLKDRELLEVMAAARRTGAFVMVHAEGYDTIRFLADALEAEGKTAPYYHGPSRPVAVEREATHRAISFAEITDVPIMIVHVSNRQAMEEIERARRRGLNIYGETCPQYLVLTEEDMDGAAMEGAKFVCSPPPRTTEDQAACWEGLQHGIFSVFSSDHCPYRFAEDGKLTAKAHDGFRWVPNGIPGIETRLPILFSEGVKKGRISLNQFVALTATNHAKTYGLYPKKGTIAVGADADIVLWDPEMTRTIDQADLHHGCDYTPYQGLEVTGWPVMTMLRGRVVTDGETLVNEAPGGEYLARERSPLVEGRQAL
ncbi:dihydropyrimidinase [Martelella endophytica]|uniref:D-hydantoinase n=1 Tax=Martelella endophytica TaxID=1486262 RepID=A0A0D5LNT6_MAREN|nr:dihydropyrimidinase [Martelella endophytica]AJY44968.1 dihydropyrimidinase [Martelella endophytica]